MWTGKINRQPADKLQHRSSRKIAVPSMQATVSTMHATVKRE